MNKTELIQKLSKKTGLSVKDSEAAVNTIFDAKPGKGLIAVELDAGRKVIIPGFGTFKSVSRKARVGTNPKTGQKMNIPAKKYVSFKAGKTLKERVSE
jgi:DNA-binding protein HU-beta